MKITQHIIILALISIGPYLKGQEISVSGLSYNPALKHARESKSLKTASDTVRFIVPPLEGSIFFDDFSTYGDYIYPESNNWLDINATINYTYPDSAVSIGVITLDCFDTYGNVYGPVGRTVPSDTLTSSVIDSIIDNNLYISFFIQGGGKADPPEFQDSLILEFKIDSAQWVSVWDTHGYESHTFSQVILPIDEKYYADSTFQFRFINYTSLSKNEVLGKEGALSNADNWHIDYIQVKSAPNIDSIRNLKDIAIYEPLLPVFANYTLIPYEHLQYRAGYLREEVALNYRTYFPTESSTFSVNRIHTFWDLLNNKRLEEKGIDIELQSTDNPFEFIHKNDVLLIQSFNTRENPEQYGSYELRSYIVPTDVDQYKWNDTVKRHEFYRDFYAYDDGTAELGFGIAGADAYQTSFATYFEIYFYGGADTLTGAHIYFNKAANKYNADSEFEVAVWDVKSDDRSMGPGNKLYSTGETNLLTPDTTKSFNNPTSNTNGFMRVDFDEDILISNHFFIGITQHTNNFLNVGYDINFGSKSNIWYSSENQWSSAANLPNIPNGSIMIRPIFGHKRYVPVKSPIITHKSEISIYPNPVKDYAYIKAADNDIHNYEYALYDILGKKILSDHINDNKIDLSNLKPGLYIINIRNKTTFDTYSAKILKAE